MQTPHSHASRREFQVSMTPMIDVVFLLLIFFVCTASFQAVESVLPTHLKVAGSATVAVRPEQELKQLERILIEIATARGSKSGGQRTIHYKINGQPCESHGRLDDRIGSLARIDASLPVVLDIGGQVPLGHAIDVYDRCRLVGLRQIQFAASPLGKGR